ncbi:DUF2061 domain-containing protein [Marinospirillum sp.]|uniref:DUF2061 domain-containing protein n=1 Tax=Marinospirillum sp. TaxID=2183934 RepID=UPI002870316A|nr:DUF2061 domain-containing protein [Marinospirillum sp.]MDR9467470.1 DUF2061 domain-containing protein [Marinospirillum sp.]
MLKTLTFGITHFCVAFVVVWLLTGDLLVSSLVAMVEPAVNTVAYYFHEKAWEKVKEKKQTKERKSKLGQWVAA